MELDAWRDDVVSLLTSDAETERRHDRATKEWVESVPRSVAVSMRIVTTPSQLMLDEVTQKVGVEFGVVNPVPVSLGRTGVAVSALDLSIVVAQLA